MKLFLKDSDIMRQLPKGVSMPQPQLEDDALRTDKVLVESVRDSYEYASTVMSDELREMRELGDLFIGRGWTSSEEQYLENLGRVARTYNIALPNIIAVEGVAINNRYRLRAYPRQDGAVEAAELHTKVLNYFLDEAQYDRQNLRAFSDSLIFRRGWKSWSWERTGRHPDGQLVVRRLNPFDVLFDADNGEVDINRGRFVIYTRFFTSDRIRQIYASNSPEMREYLDRQAQNIEGPMYKKRRERSRAFMWREAPGDRFNVNKKGGFGNDDANTFSGSHPTTDYYDASRGLYRLIEYHERRSADCLFLVYDQMSGAEVRIPHEYEEDTNFIRAQLDRFGVGQESLEWRELPEYWVIAVAPKLAPDVVLMERPYVVQDQQDDLGYSIIGQTCYDQHPDKGKHLGMMDQIRDAQISINRNLSTREDLITRMLNPDIVGEATAFEDFMEDWYGPESRKVGAVRRVGKVGKNGFPQYMFPPTSIAQLLDYNTDFLMTFAEASTGVNANLKGMQQGSGESGRLDAQRTEKSEIMLQSIYENMRNAQRTDGRFAHAMILKHARKERWIPIIGEDNSVEGISINKWNWQAGDWENKLSDDWGKVSIKIDTAAYTRTQRERIFTEGMNMVGLMQDPTQRTMAMIEVMDEWDYVGRKRIIEGLKKTLLLQVGAQMFLPFDVLLQMQLQQMGITGYTPNMLPGALQARGQGGVLPGMPGGDPLGIERPEINVQGGAAPTPPGWSASNDMETSQVRDTARIPMAQQQG